MKRKSARLIPERRKSAVLKPPAFGCLKDIPAINITRGCMHSCVYCYARGFRDAPHAGEVHLYENIPEILERELDRKRRLPRWVSFSTASDAFQDMDEILAVTFRVMEMLLERGIGISFLTKGFVPSGFIGLFRRYQPLVRAKIGLVSLNEDYRRLFEPGTTAAFRRLASIRSLTNAGVDTSVRIDPIIPVTCSDGSVEHLLKRIRVAGVRDISMSALIMRPPIMNQFRDELPFRLANGIRRYYEGQPWQRVITSAMTRLVPRNLRIARYRKIRSMAIKYGLHCRVCGCKNPDLAWECCHPWVNSGEASTPDNRQLAFFKFNS